MMNITSHGYYRLLCFLERDFDNKELTAKPARHDLSEGVVNFRFPPTGRIAVEHVIPPQMLELNQPHLFYASAEVIDHYKGEKL